MDLYVKEMTLGRDTNFMKKEEVKLLRAVNISEEKLKDLSELYDRIQKLKIECFDWIVFVINNNQIHSDNLRYRNSIDRKAIRLEFQKTLKKIETLQKNFIKKWPIIKEKE